MKTLSMERPIVFINTDEKLLINSSVLMSITTSLVFSKENKINVVADKSIQPLISYSIYYCQSNGDIVFSKYADHMTKAINNIKYYGSNSIMSKRKDIVLAVIGQKPDPTILTLCLGMTRRKLIFVGNLNAVYESPLWATMLNTLPSECIYNFPPEFVEKDIPPIKALNEIFPLKDDKS